MIDDNDTLRTSNAMKQFRMEEFWEDVDIQLLLFNRSIQDAIPYMYLHICQQAKDKCILSQANAIDELDPCLPVRLRHMWHTGRAGVMSCGFWSEYFRRIRPE